MFITINLGLNNRIKIVQKEPKKEESQISAFTKDKNIEAIVDCGKQYY